MSLILDMGFIPVIYAESIRRLFIHETSLDKNAGVCRRLLGGIWDAGGVGAGRREARRYREG
jgi:hypothetical protein